MATRSGVHYLRGNKVERSPHHLIVIDTETRRYDREKGEAHRLRLWAARYVRRHGWDKRQEYEHDHWGHDPGELADYVESLCHRKATLWLFAHNLGFELAVTMLPLLLIERGWELGEHALHADQPWARMSKGALHLVLTDSASWLPKPVKVIAQELGTSKLRMPDWGAPEEEWLTYCRRDVEIETEAICQLMDWWEAARLGNWSITGAQTGWNAMRHMPERREILIDDDPVARAFERRALYSGRREVWRVGQLDVGRYAEIDFRSAHATIAAHLPLPDKRRRRFDHMDPDDWRVRSGPGSIIAECEIAPRDGRYPVRIDRRVWHPIGRIRTVLCGPEIQEARRRGELLSIGPGYEYRISGHMSRWASWILAVLADEVEGVPPMGRMAAKGWSRSVIGKWAGHTSEKYFERPSHIDGWAIERGSRSSDHAPVVKLHLGGKCEWFAKDQWQQDAFPAVLAWVQSVTRLLLGRLMDSLQGGRVVQCNGDSCLVRIDDGAELSWDGDAIWPLEARIKRIARRVTVISPQHLVLDDERKLSGIPGSAVQLDDGRWVWDSWPRFHRQIEAARPGEYLREERHADLSHVPIARWVWENGATTAPEADVTATGATVLCPTPTPWVPGLLLALRAAQHPSLLKVTKAAGG